VKEEHDAAAGRRHRRLPRPSLPPRIASTPLPLLRQHQPPWPLPAPDLGSGRRRGGEEGSGHVRPKSHIRAYADGGATTLGLGLRRRRAEKQERERVVAERRLRGRGVRLGFARCSGKVGLVLTCWGGGRVCSQNARGEHSWAVVGATW
jgi:hypothetical protein